MESESNIHVKSLAMIQPYILWDRTQFSPGAAESLQAVGILQNHCILHSFNLILRCHFLVRKLGSVWMHSWFGFRNLTFLPKWSSWPYSQINVFASLYKVPQWFDLRLSFFETASPNNNEMRGTVTLWAVWDRTIFNKTDGSGFPSHVLTVFRIFWYCCCHWKEVKLKSLRNFYIFKWRLIFLISLNLFWSAPLPW